MRVINLEGIFRYSTDFKNLILKSIVHMLIDYYYY